MKIFRLSSFNRHRILQEISQSLYSSLLIYETYLINIAPAITKKTLLRPPPFNLTLERISYFEASISSEIKFQILAPKFAVSSLPKQIVRVRSPRMIATP